MTSHGQLIPQGGGDAIPLIRNQLVIGRRESCDIILPFPNVSGVHCELVNKSGYWIIQDLGSKNGIKVNGERVQKKTLQPGDMITIAKRNYKIEYELVMGARALEEFVEEQEDVMSKSLLERAGLAHPPSPRKDKRRPELTEE